MLRNIVSAKKVIMTGNVLILCVSKVLSTGSWGGGHKISEMLNRWDCKILHPFDRGGGHKILHLKFAQFLKTPCHYLGDVPLIRFNRQQWEIFCAACSEITKQ